MKKTGGRVPEAGKGCVFLDVAESDSWLNYILFIHFSRAMSTV